MLDQSPTLHPCFIILGVDLLFVKRALDVAQSSVYSLHKTSTREHILKRANDFGASCGVLAELKFDLPRTYGFHKKQSVDVYVDFIRFEPQR